MSIGVFVADLFCSDTTPFNKKVVFQYVQKMGRKRKARVQCDQDGNEYHDDPMGYGESPAGGVHVSLLRSFQYDLIQLREDRSSAEHVSKRQCVQGRFVLAEESSSGVSSLSIRHQAGIFWVLVTLILIILEQRSDKCCGNRQKIRNKKRGRTLSFYPILFSFSLIEPPTLPSIFTTNLFSPHLILPETAWSLSSIRLRIGHDLLKTFFGQLNLKINRGHTATI